MLEFSVQQRYVVVGMMFLSMTITFLFRMSFPIVLTQMVYVPNINKQNSDNKTISNNEIICPVKHHMTNNLTSPDPDLDPMLFNSVIYWILN